MGRFRRLWWRTGFPGVKEVARDRAAEPFVDARPAAIVFDNRCVGDREGTSRQAIGSWLEVRDCSEAVTFALRSPFVPWTTPSGTSRGCSPSWSARRRCS